jgi:hypothetical protein
MNPTLVPFARGDSSIKITAMIGIGLIAMPTANGRISPITEPIERSILSSNQQRCRLSFPRCPKEVGS